MFQQLQQLDFPVKKNHIFFIYKSNFSSLHVILQYLIFYYNNKRFEDHLIFQLNKGLWDYYVILCKVLLMPVIFYFSNFFLNKVVIQHIIDRG